MAERLRSRARGLFVNTRWGSYGMVALYLSLFSGVIVALQYDPGHPYYSVSSLDILAPFGLFWRSLHFYASQAFFLLTLVHFLAIIIRREHESIAFKRWLLLIFSLVALLLILFTGYVLRADATGASAGMIAENILLSTPLLGRPLNWLLFDLTQEGVKRVYANHLVGLGLLWLVLSWDHLRHYRISWRQSPTLVLLLVAFPALVAAPLEPERLGAFHIGGPWFFIGLQELLRHLPPFWAGIVWPGLLVCALALLRRPALASRARLFCLAWLAIYALLTAVGLSR